MRQSVLTNFMTINTRWEGYLTFMYLDALGYVTTGMGDLVDPVGLALALPWKNSDGSAASQAQIAAAWNAVDALRTAPKGLKQSGPAATGGQHFGGYTTIRLTSSDVNALVQSKLAQNEAYVRKTYPQWDSWPADAQFAVMSMAWAMGAGFVDSFKQFDAAMNAGQYAAAAPLSVFKGVGVQPRIAANQQMLQNAQAVVDTGADPATLYYPGTVPAGGGGGGGSGGVGTTIGQVALIAAGVLGAGLVATVVVEALRPGTAPAWIGELVHA